MGEPKMEPQYEPAQPSREESPLQPVIAEDEAIPIQPGKTEQGAPESVKTADQRAPVHYSDLNQSFARYWQKFKKTIGKIRELMVWLRKKIFPNTENRQLFTPTIKIFLLLIIPMVLIAVSLTIYSHSGKEEQFTGYLDLAQQYQTLAGMTTETFQQYDYWKKALENVIKAEDYGSSTLSTNLRLKAQNTIDSMGLTKRLDFRPALTQKLPDNVKITKVTASGSDVYLLDKTSGSILRIALIPRVIMNWIPILNAHRVLQG